MASINQLEDLDAPKPQTSAPPVEPPKQAEKPKQAAPKPRKQVAQGPTVKKEAASAPAAKLDAAPTPDAKVEPRANALAPQVAYRLGMPCDQTPNCKGKWSVLSSHKHKKEGYLERHLVCSKCEKKAPQTQKIPF